MTSSDRKHTPLDFRVMVRKDDNLVILDFFQKLRWIGLTSEQARTMAERLLAEADRADQRKH